MIDEVEEILDEYVEDRLQFEEEPYWLHLRHSREGEMEWETFSYFPEAHYNLAITNQLREAIEEEGEGLVPDGGSTTHLHNDGRRSKVYYWLNPDTGAALYHTEANGEEANPFFGSIQEAEQYLESREKAAEDDLHGLSLYEARVEKVENAVEVLMDQAGIGDF